MNYNNQKIPNKNQQDYEQQTVNNYFINTNAKKQTNKPKNNYNQNNKNDLDLFVESNANIAEFYAEEQIEDDNYNNYENDNENDDNFSKNYSIDKQTKLLNITKIIMGSSISIMMAILFCYNLLQFNSLKKQIEKNNTNIEVNELILEKEKDTLSNITTDELTDTFIDNGYQKKEDDDIPTYTPKPKQVPVTFNKQTNWFDIICNNFYEFLSH